MNDLQQLDAEGDRRAGKPAGLLFASREVLISFIWAVMIGLIMMANGVYTHAVDFVYANF